MPSQKAISIKIRWKPIRGYGGKYLINDVGQIFSRKCGRLLRPSKKNRRYHSITLCHRGKLRHYSIHKLVAKAFIPNPKRLPCINHKDEYSNNNAAYNLEWCTQTYNINYGRRNRLVSKAMINGKQSKKIIQLKNGKIVANFPSINEAERAGYWSWNVIRACKTGKKYLGFNWRYV